MPTTAIDSAVFRDIFSTEPMRRVFSDENRIQKYLDFEAGLARAQARLGIIPQNACDEIAMYRGTLPKIAGIRRQRAAQNYVQIATVNA